MITYEDYIPNNPNIGQFLISKTFEWFWARMAHKRKPHKKHFIGKPSGKVHLGRPRKKWTDMVNRNLDKYRSYLQH